MIVHGRVFVLPSFDSPHGKYEQIPPACSLKGSVGCDTTGCVSLFCVIDSCSTGCVLSVFFEGRRSRAPYRTPSAVPGPVCVECLIGKQKKPILFKVTEPSSIPSR